MTDKWENGRDVFEALGKSIETPGLSVKHLSASNLRDAQIYASSQIVLWGRYKQIAKVLGSIKYRRVDNEKST